MRSQSTESSLETIFKGFNQLVLGIIPNVSWLRLLEFEAFFNADTFGF